MNANNDKNKIAQEEEKSKREVKNPQEQEKRTTPLEKRGSLKRRKTHERR